MKNETKFEIMTVISLWLFVLEVALPVGMTILGFTIGLFVLVDRHKHLNKE